MSTETDRLIQRLVQGDATASSTLLELAESTMSPRVLVAAAVLADRPALLARAALNATTSGERQLVSIAVIYFEGSPDLLNGLVRDHLADHPDDALVAWIADRPPYPAPTTPQR